MLPLIEQERLHLSRPTAVEKKASLGQFFTPASTAKFMARLFPSADGNCRLLDAGAGIGSLATAFLERCLAQEFNFEQIHVTAYEIDSVIQTKLQHSLEQYSEYLPYSFTIVAGDFIENAINRIQFKQDGFTHAILNPPYKKISSQSRQRWLLRQVEIETVNLYAAFVSLSLMLMAPGGQLVAIIPRSFCNGPYYRPFRDVILQHAAIRHLHLFNSRSTIFKADQVLQENIVIRLERGGCQGAVTISTSSDDSFSDLTSFDCPFNQIVLANNSERFIHIPTSLQSQRNKHSTIIQYRLTDLGIQVATGPIVDFRMTEQLCQMPAAHTVPMLYPCHFTAGTLIWPKLNTKKPNAIQHNEITKKWLYPNGFYCVVRRFSSKEEKRRIVASVVNPNVFNAAPMLGFENHLNVFHNNKQGLPEALAHGLTLFLNTTIADEHFRQFNGHTQVNATDLKQMLYPSRDVLMTLGAWAMQQDVFTQTIIDDQFNSLTV